jgi:UDP-galactopyranose mutase
LSPLYPQPAEPFHSEGHIHDFLTIKSISVDKLVHADIICFCHLRWYFVYQRPQHLLSRFAKHHRVFFWEEPVHDDEQKLEIREAEKNLWVITPHIKASDEDRKNGLQREWVRELMNKYRINDYIFWYYSPLAFSFSQDFKPLAIVYDCMDELSAFRFAPKELKTMEAMLMNRADIVFTGGRSLYEAKEHLHPNIHCFPSSIDKKHFANARKEQPEPGDQSAIPHPRIGFYGVIDERFDTHLLQQLSQQHPEWHFVIIGPTAKIDPASLPQAGNLHFLGGKSYNELPVYLAGWDVAMMPFALNESTRYISPTKTPEFLAGGKPVVSTSIRDVVNPYGEKNLVYIADTVNEFSEAIQKALNDCDNKQWLENVDRFLENISWDQTFEEMHQLIHQIGDRRSSNAEAGREAYV